MPKEHQTFPLQVEKLSRAEQLLNKLLTHKYDDKMWPEGFLLANTCTTHLINLCLKFFACGFVANAQCSSIYWRCAI